MDSDSWKDNLFNDRYFNTKDPYSYDNVIKNLELVNTDLDNIKPFEFCQAVFEFTKAFATLGTAVSMGFSDITEKVQIWRDLFNIYTDSDSLQSVIDKEIDLKIIELNGENNKKKGHKKGTTYAKYSSGARTLVRLGWFLHFMHHMFVGLLTTKDAFTKIIKKSYEVVLSPHHPWLVRQGASVALSFAPSKRESALKIFFGIYYLIFIYYRN
jgi:hypothetical protein